MYAVIKTGGKQYRVQPGDLMVVEKLAGDPGANVDFDAGTPAVDPDTGLQYVVGDPNASAKPRIAGSAYTSSFAGATSTTSGSTACR